MVLETKERFINPDVAEENNEPDEQKLDEQQIMEMCREVYFAKHAKEASAQNYRLFSQYDFKIWVQSNSKDLMAFLYPDTDQEKLKLKISRWLSQKLPPKI